MAECTCTSDRMLAEFRRAALEAELLPAAPVFPHADLSDIRCNLFSLTPPDLHSPDCGESPPPDPVG